MNHRFRRTKEWCECVREGCGYRVPMQGVGMCVADRECLGRVSEDERAAAFNPGPSPPANVKQKLPNPVRRGLNFAKALTKHVLAGMPTLSEEDTLRRFTICCGCDAFVPVGDDKGFCGKCGCCSERTPEHFLNAANWESKKCPHPKGDKWAMTDEELKAIGHPEVTPKPN